MPHKIDGIDIVPNPNAPDMVLGEAIRFDIVDGLVYITWAAQRPTEPAPPCGFQLHVLGRAVLGKGAAARMATGLYDFLKRNDALPPETVVPAQVQ